jgi:hypothetical protein
MEKSTSAKVKLKTSTEEVLFTILFFINIFGTAFLCWILGFGDHLDSFVKVISAVWAGASIILGSLGFKRNENGLKLGKVLVLWQMKILNILVIAILVYFSYQKYFHEITITLEFKNEYGELVQEGVLFNQFATTSLDLTPGTYEVKFENRSYKESGQINDKIYVPLIWGKPFTRKYQINLIRGAIEFKNLPINFPDETMLEIVADNKKIDKIEKTITESSVVVGNLPPGNYRYNLLNQWIESEPKKVKIFTKDTIPISVNFKTLDSGFIINIDKTNIPEDKLRNSSGYSVILDNSLEAQYSWTKLNFKIEIKDKKNYFLEIKDVENELYYSENLALSEVRVDNIECKMTTPQLSFVEFFAPYYKGKLVTVDGEERGNLDSKVGTIVLPIFDGYRKIKIGVWERLIRFPVLDDYIEVR